MILSLRVPTDIKGGASGSAQGGERQDLEEIAGDIEDGAGRTVTAAMARPACLMRGFGPRSPRCEALNPLVGAPVLDQFPSMLRKVAQCLDEPAAVPGLVLKHQGEAFSTRTGTSW